MNQDMPVVPKKPNRLAAALGTGTIYGFLTGLVTAPIAGIRLSRGGFARIESNMSSPLTWLILSVPTIATVVGWVKGWQSAQAQHDFIDNVSRMVPPPSAYGYKNSVTVDEAQVLEQRQQSKHSHVAQHTQNLQENTTDLQRI